MEINRKKSYSFNCPCCSQPHTRRFDYYAKFRGFINENESIADVNGAYVYESAVVDNGIFEEKTLSVGDGIYRCGNCFEFFKFTDDESAPVRLNDKEKQVAKSKFKPINIVYDKAVMNSVASFFSLLENYGCEFDWDKNEIVISGAGGKEYRFNFADKFVEAFYGKNPMFDIKETAAWGLNKQSEQ